MPQTLALIQATALACFCQGRASGYYTIVNKYVNKKALVITHIFAGWTKIGGLCNERLSIMERKWRELANSTNKFGEIRGIRSFAKFTLKSVTYFITTTKFRTSTG